MDVFDLVAKIRLDSSEYEQGVGKAKGTFSTLASGVGKAVGTVAKVGAAAVTAAAAGITALTKMGIEGYAQYEQLVGGVETLFKDSQGTVMKYAESAYKTAGMSANQYMETVTSFSASLIQSLDGDTAKAAEIGNMAITDMSDNANKMGTSIEMIQNAYNGFAKGNYTMLDNLKLGYGGTKTEMERLLADAEKISGIKYDISSFADVTEAIHVMQEEMGIAGTTAREAATTIEGSISMMKGAWQNLVVGMADENANMDVLINNFVESTATAAQNLLPRIEQTLKGIGELIAALAPIIAEALPQLVAAVLPSLLSAAVSLVTSFVNGMITALPALYNALLEAVEIILVEVFGVSQEKAGEFAAGVNSFFTSIKDGFMALVESAQTEGTWLNEVWTGLQETAKLLGDFLVALWNALSAAFSWCVNQINTDGTWLNMIWENIKVYISGAIEHIQNIIKIFTAILQGDWSAAWEAVKDFLENIWETMTEMLSNYWNAIKNIFNNALNAVKSYVSDKFNAVKDNIKNIFDNVKETISNAWENVKNVVSVALQFIVELVKAAFNLITLPFRAIWENCKETIMEVWNAIKTAVTTALDAIKTTISNVWNAIVDVLAPILNAVKSAVTTVWDAIKNTISNVMNTIKSTISNAWDSVKSAVSGAIENVKTAISSGLNTAKSTVSGILDSIKTKFRDIFEGAKSIVKSAIDAIKGFFDFSWELPSIKLPHISVSGKFSLDPPSVPSFSISWYKKAYDSAMILGNPTIFGYSAASGKFLGGGDGNGNEVVAGESYLMGLIGSVVASQTAAQNEPIVLALADILEAINGGNKELARALRAGHTIELNGREFGRAVRSYA